MWAGRHIKYEVVLKVAGCLHLIALSMAYLFIPYSQSLFHLSGKNVVGILKWDLTKGLNIESGFVQQLGVVSHGIKDPSLLQKMNAIFFGGEMLFLYLWSLTVLGSL